MSASKCFSLSTKNNSETCVCLQFAGKRAMLYIFYRNSAERRNSAQLLLISHRIFENTRIMHVFTPKCFSLSTKNNSEAASTCRRGTHVNCIILYILHQNSAERRSSAQLLLINHQLFKNTRNVLMPASIYFSAEYKEQPRNHIVCMLCMQVERIILNNFR